MKRDICQLYCWSAAVRQPLHLRYCPTVFFRHVCLITLSLLQRKFEACLKNITSCCFLLFKACLTFLHRSSVCRAQWRHPRGAKDADVWSWQFASIYYSFPHTPSYSNMYLRSLATCVSIPRVLRSVVLCWNSLQGFTRAFPLQFCFTAFTVAELCRREGKDFRTYQNREYWAQIFICVTMFVMVSCDFLRRAWVVASRRCDDNRAPHSFVKCPRGWL
jgi:hypothetical protein